MTRNRHYSDSISTSLPVSDVSNRVTHGMMQLARGSYFSFFTHNFLRFSKSKTFKRLEIASTPPDTVYTLQSHDMSWQVGTNLHHSFIILSGPPATASTSFCTLSGKICSGAFQFGKQVIHPPLTGQRKCLTCGGDSLLLAMLEAWIAMSVVFLFTTAHTEIYSY